MEGLGCLCFLLLFSGVFTVFHLSKEFSSEMDLLLDGETLGKSVWGGCCRLLIVNVPLLHVLHSVHLLPALSPCADAFVDKCLVIEIGFILQRGHRFVVEGWIPAERRPCFVM